MEHENNSSSDMPSMMAMMLQMFGGAGEADEDGQAAAEQSAKIRQAMEMARMFQMFSNMGQAPDTETKETASPPGEDDDAFGHAAKNGFYDTPILTPELVTIKSAIPHIERKYQKPLGILVKLIEMQRLMDFYGPEKGLQAMSGDVREADSAERRRNMLCAIKSNTADETARTKIEIMLKALDISELMRRI
ncbi:MAG: hypothetical protein FWE20_04355 [Defluviitaleaceae bacterium]|nr:hypothetical protein [Defluviitaleaceae bacterium]